MRFRYDSYLHQNDDCPSVLQMCQEGKKIASAAGNKTRRKALHEMNISTTKHIRGTMSQEREK